MRTLVHLRHHTVQVPATSANLGPGYDAYGLALDLHLIVRSVERSAQSERVAVSGEGHADLSSGDDNLVWRSLLGFCRRFDLPVPDVALCAVNAIPLERGLGSSSSAIVAGLVLARALTGFAVGDRELVTLASELEGHPDNVAPALLGGLVACTADDAGNVVVRRVNPRPGLRVIVLVPSFRQATSDARGVLPDHLDVAEVTLQASRAGHVLGALGGLWPVAPAAAGDRLHEPARMSAMPASGGVLRELRAAGLHAWLSGAGPSVAIAVNEIDDHASAWRGIAERHGFEPRRLTIDLAGSLACPDGSCVFSGGDRCVQCPRERL